MAPFSTNATILCTVASILACAQAGYAPKDAPKLPAGFCPSATGMATSTTGECMCNWQHKDGCVGSKCEFQMGLSWYHYSCDDCNCVAEPSS
eukprot:CAMPEP_0201867330 /NCGR_PEP_ID=MMETSP0902-20130614/1596_1 /ASSEMBLY_ACC=CAM_ASM_000551 /TAXON_ID=420261 /ORGANISM="Thalassiosira antarctica, Strain CCMP982" /LENGTH=91 /DNA_ID=CAMNT_0048392469 /DNA_START=38 /DNA_END=316 /DNA_ORIENTATION=+